MAKTGGKYPSYCGIDCVECEFRSKKSCSGCKESKGKMFWGECEVAVCCIQKELDHCGMCSDFPCEVLKDYSYDKENGDDGKRIRNLEEWVK